MVAVLWATVVAPNAAVTLATPARVVVELVTFGLAAAALHAAGQPRLAWALAVLVLLNEVLLLAWGQ